MICLSHLCGFFQTLAPLVYHPCQVLARISTCINMFGMLFCTTLRQRKQIMLRTWIPRSSSIPWFDMLQSISCGSWFWMVQKYISKCINMYQHVSECIKMHFITTYFVGPVTEKLEVLHGAVPTPFQQSGAWKTETTKALNTTTTTQMKKHTKHSERLQNIANKEIIGNLFNNLLDILSNLCLKEFPGVFKFQWVSNLASPDLGWTRLPERLASLWQIQTSTMLRCLPVMPSSSCLMLLGNNYHNTTTRMSDGIRGSLQNPLNRSIQQFKSLEFCTYDHQALQISALPQPSHSTEIECKKLVFWLDDKLFSGEPVDRIGQFLRTKCTCFMFRY